MSIVSEVKKSLRIRTSNILFNTNLVVTENGLEHHDLLDNTIFYL